MGESGVFGLRDRCRQLLGVDIVSLLIRQSNAPQRCHQVLLLHGLGLLLGDGDELLGLRRLRCNLVENRLSALAIEHISIRRLETLCLQQAAVRLNERLD